LSDCLFYSHYFRSGSYPVALSGESHQKMQFLAIGFVCICSRVFSPFRLSYFYFAFVYSFYSCTDENSVSNSGPNFFHRACNLRAAHVSPPSMMPHHIALSGSFGGQTTTMSIDSTSQTSSVSVPFLHAHNIPRTVHADGTSSSLLHPTIIMVPSGHLLIDFVDFFPFYFTKTAS
jgi:hypothetical protein